MRVEEHAVTNGWQGDSGYAVECALGDTPRGVKEHTHIAKPFHIFVPKQRRPPPNHKE